MTPFFRGGYLLLPHLAGPLAPSRLDDLKKRYEENPRRFFAPLANEYRKNGELDQAIQLCEAHLGDQPGNMNGHVVYGQALFDSGRYDQAETTFTTALSLDPENLIALRHLGDISRLNGNAAAALDWYQRVLDADPRNDEILGFIDALKAESAAPPPPPREPTPVATPRVSVPTPAVPSAALSPSDAPTREVPAQRPSMPMTPTPIAPIETVAPKRPSVSLIDLDIDTGMDQASAPEAAVSPPEPAAIGDLEFGNVDFGDVGGGTPEQSTAPQAEGFESPMFEAPAAESGGRADGFEAGEFEAPADASAIPAADGLESSDSLFAVGPTIDLPSGDAPLQEGPSGPRPQVFVTETMAELYLQQGFRDEALKVYRQLAEMNPDDASLRERIAALEVGGRASMSFEKLATEVPEYAEGTDSLVPMSDAPPSLPDGLGFDDPPPVAAVPEMPVEALDFDMSTTIPSPTGEIPAVPPASDFEPLSLGDEPMELASDPAAAPEPQPVVAAAPEPEPVPAAMPEMIVEPVTEPRPVVETAVAAPRAATPSGQSARAFFAALAQRRALRPDGTLPRGMDAVEPAVEAPPQNGGGTIDHLFHSAPSESDEAIGLALMTAVGLVDTPAIKGRPTQAAGSELSLDSVFRSESPLRTSGPIQRQSQVLKFDQFFESSAPAPETPAAPGTDAPAAPADDAQFQAWLQQLKGQ